MLRSPPSASGTVRPKILNGPWVLLMLVIAVKIYADKLEDLCTEILKKLDVPPDEANIGAKILVDSNLRGHDSHGIRLLPSYVKKLRTGELKPHAELKTLKETSCTALIDAQWGFGEVAAKKTMDITINKAKGSGVSVVGLANSGHIGRVGAYPEMALEHDMIGIVIASTGLGVCPYGGKEKLMGTNPIAIAIPAEKEDPISLDMATSVRAGGIVMLKHESGEKLPEDVIINANGNPTKDPADMLERGGMLLPFGGIVGYKGYGLNLVIEMLCSVLTGGMEQMKIYAGNHALFYAIDIAAFTSVDEFKNNVDDYLNKIKSSKKAPGFDEILIPGQRAARTKRKRLKEGIPIPDGTWKKIAATASDVGLDIGGI